ncbi:MAG TPA: M23 family metallopeptidase [Verrucomicrobiae bacterium]|nr:M23 family metallopeptidase [Verrucomicrobiae bacterium]
MKFRSCLGVLLFFARAVAAQPFQLPTANHAIFESGGQERYFVPTPGKTWVSGTFGCVRSDGWQMHEGLDIKCLQRDRSGEPIDPVMATADGVVAYINDKPSLSNYGRYIVILHHVGAMEIYSLYAHLSEVQSGLRVGRAVRAGEQIAVMGRTSNTRERISKDRAHVHFELNLFYSEHFNSWYKRHFPGERNDHGIYNGENLVGIDARLILLAEHEEGARFDLLNWIQHRPELCRVLVRQTDFPWLRRYPMLIKQGALGPNERPAGYEIAIDFNGLPFEWIPRPAGAFKGAAKYQLLSVNEPEYTKNPCRRLVTRQGSRWELASKGLNLLELLTD